MKYAKIFLLISILFSNYSYSQDKEKLDPLKPEIRENYIQKAAELRKQEKYNEAIGKIDSILLKNPKDAPMLLFKGDMLLQAHRFPDAAEDYRKIIPLNYQKTICQINLSYAEFMSHKTGNALKDAKAAWIGNPTNVNATINYFNAQLWNIKVKEAAAFLDKQKDSLSKAQLLVLKARLFTTAGDYRKGLSYYAQLVRSYPDKNYIMEYSEVLLGKKEWKPSYDTVLRHRKDFTPSEYNGFMDKYKGLKRQLVGTEWVYFKDGGENSRVSSSAWWQDHDGKVYRAGLRAGISEYSSPNGNTTGKRFDNTFSNFIHGEITERWNLAWSGKSEADLQNIHSDTDPSFTGLTWKQTVQYQPHDRRMIGAYLSSQFIDWTATILSRRIRVNTLGYITHILVSGHTGIYSQGGIGFLSDTSHNKSYQFFGSIYHLFRTEPTLKVGLNLTLVHYSNPHDLQLSSLVTTDKSLDYAPSFYRSLEVFGDYSTALPNLSKFYLKLQGGAGIQKFDSQGLTTNHRASVELGTHLNHWDAYIRYQNSNASSLPGVVGYQFNWLVGGLVYKW